MQNQSTTFLEDLEDGADIEGMAYVKAGKKIVSGQVDESVSSYIAAFAKARGCTKSVVVSEILSDWKEKKRASNKRDALAHEEVSEQELSVEANAPESLSNPTRESKSA